MRAAYLRLHRLGHAHSVEVFDDERLVGGLYGVAVGRMFFGESMFSAYSGGSKVALAALAGKLSEWKWPLLDAQVANDHLLSLGAECMPRRDFLAQVRELVSAPGQAGSWTRRFGQVAARTLD
jgi:leucyl/phenylalanyl-tRNA--protein transferase